jgi:hypothetical protein
MPRADLLSRLRLEPRDVPMLCVSLKMLAVAADTSAAAPLAIQTCYGLNRVLGYVLDESNRDIILYGRQDPLYPAIHFADICTFVQNLWHKDRIRYVNHEFPWPSCSLDPRPGSMAAVDRIMQDTAASQLESPRERDRMVSRLIEALGPQEIRIHGVRRDARVAHVMIDADYHMKRVSQGHLTLPGVTSCPRIGLDRQKRGEHVTSHMSRFWFHLDRGHPTFLCAEGIVEIEDCAMVVLTESQVSADDGSLIDGGDADLDAQAFAECLSNQLRVEGVGVREYRDLSNLYRLFALLKAIQFQGADRAVGFGLKTFERWQSSAGELPSCIPALANIVADVEESRTERRAYFSLVCGGVSMDAQLSQDRFIQNQDPQAGGKRNRILKSRPDVCCAFWAT